MQFSNTTNKNGILQKIERICGLPDGRITGDSTLLKQMTANVNDAQNSVQVLILRSMDGWDFDDSNNTDYPIGTTALVASQRDYTYPSDILNIKRVDISYDGVNFYRATQVDSSQFNFGLGNDTNTDSRFSKSSPAYDNINGSIFIYPMASTEDVGNGATLRIEFTRTILDFLSTDTTKEPGFDKNFHVLLAWKASLDFAIEKSLDLKNDCAAMIAKLEDDLMKFYGKKESDTNYSFQALNVDYN